MRIVLDMQGAQSESHFIGLDGCMMSLAKAIVRKRGEHEVVLALSGLFPDTIEPLRTAFQSLLPQENIRVWYAPGFVNDCDSENEWCREITEIMREAFIRSLTPDILLMSSLFEGYVDGTVASIGRLDRVTPVSVFFYNISTGTDSWNRVNNGRSLKQYGHYEKGCLNQADICLTLSESAAQEAARKFMFVESNIVNLVSNLEPQCQFSSDQLEFQCLKDEDSESSVFEVESDFWDKCAINAVAAFVSFVDNKKTSPSLTMASRRPRLAFVSPLPPERSGISDYSSELLPFLADHYSIDVVVDQTKVTADWVLEHCNVLTIEEFEKTAHDYERVLYHFGNNPMHAKMFELLKQFKGVVVLHDFFLSGVQWYRETYGIAINSLWNELYLSHAYKAVKQRSQEHDEAVTFRYPCNFSILQNSLGIIVHSENSLRLAEKWYGQSNDFTVVPLLRNPAEIINKQQARKILGLSESDFVVCSFGFIGKTKKNHKLLDAWEKSDILSGDSRCKLIYVGDTDDSPYCRELLKRVGKLSKSGSAKITRWTDANTYRLYLAAADVAVQLRALSRGETSAAVLDCLNYAIATVVNTNGSMAELPDETVQKIPDEFTTLELADALELLFKDPEERLALGQRARRHIKTVHDPARCAEGYARSIERFYTTNACNRKSLINALSRVIPSTVEDQQLFDLANDIAFNFPEKSAARTLFLDVSVVAHDDFKTGIQRAVRALTLALIDHPPFGFRIEPVYLSEDNGRWQYRYARNYTLGLLNSPCGWIGDDPIEVQSGDMLLGLDLAGGYVIQADRQGVYCDLKNKGVKVSFVVYDLIPIQFENIYPPGFKEGHADWLRVVAKMDLAICISKSVAEEFTEWVAKNAPERVKSIDVRWFHLGADLDTSSPTSGLTENAPKILDKIESAPSFLMVGTVEPRKGHRQVLKAFETLWLDNQDMNLVVVGKNGWMVDDLSVELRQHPELGKHLFWLEGISDEYLEKVYEVSTCLIAASLGEGFGLPLIEAAQHKLPIVARELPVFREVAGGNAYYFPNDSSPAVLSYAIQDWLELFKKMEHPKSDEIPWMTWRQSAQQLMDVFVHHKSYEGKTNGTSG